MPLPRRSIRILSSNMPAFSGKRRSAKCIMPLLPCLLPTTIPMRSLTWRHKQTASLFRQDGRLRQKKRDMLTS